ncbi:MAG TPA: hypothetical protein VIY48_20955, partial [Candidatus Paceibacterota bacterium]
MKRSAFKTRSAPMKRSPWPPADNKTTMKRSEMKSRVRKPTVSEGSKYLEACRGERCYLQITGVCIARDWASPDVVPCHSNLLQHGKGRGIKAENRFSFPGCRACHFWLDQSMVPTKDERREATLA